MMSRTLSNPTHSRHQRLAFTLVELLVVMAVLATLAAIAIPLVRLTTRGRVVRESARYVNSSLASARDRAMVTGFGGVELVRSANYIDPTTNVYFGCTEMYQLKLPPIYAGDTTASGVSVIADNGVQPDGSRSMTFTLTGASILVQEHDKIRLDFRGPWYEITSPGSGTVTVEIPSGYPLPPASNNFDPPIPFQIQRQPVRDESSRVVLPAGTYIDLRLSGPIDWLDVDGEPTTLTTFGLAPAFVGPEAGNSAVVLFNPGGGVSHVHPNGLTSPELVPTSPVNLLVVRDQVGEVTERDNLSEPNNLWVSVDQNTGATHTASLGETVTAGGNITQEQIQQSQILARKRQQAKQ